MARFIIKKKQNKPLQKRQITVNNKQENINNMDTKEKIEMVSSLLDEQPKYKRIKKDKGLIERTENSKIILTEDNKELLKG